MNKNDYVVLSEIKQKQMKWQKKNQHTKKHQNIQQYKNNLLIMEYQ